MFSKRTNILLKETMWEKLQQLAQTQNRSAADLIRDAITQVYFSNSKQQSIRSAFEDILATRKQQKGKIDYKSLISEGRKL